MAQEKQQTPATAAEKDKQVTPSGPSSNRPSGGLFDQNLMEAFFKFQPTLFNKFQDFVKSFHEFDSNQRQHLVDNLGTFSKEDNARGTSRGHHLVTREETRPPRVNVPPPRVHSTIEEQLQKVLGSEGGEEEDDSPFIQRIQETPMPGKFELPDLKAYGRDTDPMVFLQIYKNAMRLRNAPNDFMCKAFPIYLMGQAQLPRSIRSFYELGTLFHTRFFQGKKIRKTITEWMSLKQDREESIRAYYCRVTKEQLQVEGISEKTIIATFTNGLYPYGAPATLRQKLTKEPPHTL
ncbi:OLC1v1019307C1 [Oldenlandia corymbosa var. corymbosa]|uniref:OLC1v1019307C1 n=1 Tax=Oldenlandia corymbosa var. corymbosa TaxID=529605 RepID=A0AAV1EDL6_OLDCO|nr:OLC1v1019307C1 [Oldenlandia corymbosa var. corymbosa]